MRASGDHRNRSIARFVDHAQKAVTDPRAKFATADALALPADEATIDVVTSALVLNFIPDRAAALKEMCRVLRPDGLLSFYVWDYPGGGMGLIDAFWNAAARVDDPAAGLNESDRFPFCTHDGLFELCQGAGLADPAIEAIEVETEFAEFDAFWHPFTLGAGPAPGYCKSLSETQRDRLKKELETTFGLSGPIRLPARAWAVKVRSAQKRRSLPKTRYQNLHKPCQVFGHGGTIADLRCTTENR